MMRYPAAAQWCRTGRIGRPLLVLALSFALVLSAVPSPIQAAAEAGTVVNLNDLMVQAGFDPSGELAQHADGLETTTDGMWIDGPTGSTTSSSWAMATADAVATIQNFRLDEVDYLLAIVVRSNDGQAAQFLASYTPTEDPFDVTVRDGDGRVLGEETVTMSSNCSGGGDACAVAAVSGAVAAVGCALVPLLGPIAAAACAIAGLATVATGYACANEPEPCPTPQTLLECVQDSCYFFASYVMPAPLYHRVRLEWIFQEMRDYPNNETDLVYRYFPQNDYSRVYYAEPTSFWAARYTVTSTIWHSDIRCDGLVSVDMSDVNYGLVVPMTRQVSKPVPADPNYQYCSNYGMAGEFDPTSSWSYL